MKITSLLTLLLAASILANAQDKDLMAQNYYLQAEDAYNNHSYLAAKELLEKAETVLGKTNSKILDLKIRDINELLKSNILLPNMTNKYQLEIKNNIDTFFQITNSSTYPKEKYFAILNIKDEIDKIKISESLENANFLPSQESEIIQRCLTARGGYFNLSQIHSLITLSTITVMGSNMDVITKKKSPNLLAIEMSIGKEIAFKQVFNGTTGYMLVEGKKETISNDNLSVIKGNSLIFTELFFMDNYPTLIGKKQIENNTLCYEMKFNEGNDNIRYCYFDCNTGFVVKDSLIHKSKDALQTTITQFSDYRQVANIYFPFKIVKRMSNDIKIEEIIKEIRLNEIIDDSEFN